LKLYRNTSSYPWFATIHIILQNPAFILKSAFGTKVTYIVVSEPDISPILTMGNCYILQGE